MIKHLLGTMLLPALIAVTAPASAQTTATFGGSDAIGSIFDRQNKLFTKIVNEKAAGKMKINFIEGEQLGNDTQVIEQMMGGIVQIYGDDLSWYARWVNDFNVVTWGFTLRDYDHAAAFVKSNAFKSMAEQLRAKHGLRILAAAPSQPRITFSVKPLKTAHDFNGMKMRVPEIKSYLVLWETLGTRPTRVAWGETFLALKTGLVESAEGGVSSAYSAKFHEAAKNVLLTDHINLIGNITVNERWFQSLSPDLQKLVTAAAEEAVQWAFQTMKNETDGIIAKIKAEGATVSKIDTKPIRDKALGAVAKLEAEGFWRPGLWKEIQATGAGN